MSAKAEAEVGVREALQSFLSVLRSDSHHLRDGYEIHIERAVYEKARAALANLPAKTESGCICQDQHRRGYCTEPGCPYAKTERAAVVEECARVAERFYDIDFPERADAIDIGKLVCKQVAGAIRALVPPLTGDSTQPHPLPLSSGDQS